MKLDKDEIGKMNFTMKKLNTNVPKTINELEQFNSAFNERPFTTFKTRNRIFEKKVSFQKNNFYMPKPSRATLVSKYNSQNYYLDKNNINIRRSKTKNNLVSNEYFGQEALADKLIKLKKALNKLNNQNTEQKIILYKQKKELKKQNQILNKVKEKFFFENIYKNFEVGISTENWNGGFGFQDKENRNQTSHLMHKQKSMEEIRSLPNQEKVNDIQDKIDNLNFKNNYTDLKESYKKILFQNEIKDKEIQNLKEQIEQNKLSNETNLSNLKMLYTQLKEELSKKSEEINKLKKYSKCTKYNEIMKEKEIYENEMINIKLKFNQAMEVQEKHKFCVKKIKFLVDEINNKDAKIELYENKLLLNSKNSKEIIENLQKELAKKNAKIQKLENENKKLNIKVNNPNTPLLKIKKEKNYLLKESKQNNFIIKSKPNQKKENKKSEYNIIEQRNKNIYVNHNMNFCINVKNEVGDKNENLKNLVSNENIDIDNNENINIKNDQIENNENNNKDNANSYNKEKENEQNNNNNIKNESINEIMNLNNELLLIYLEIKKRNISIEVFINEVFSKLIQENSIQDNKNLYINYLVQYFKISDGESKKIIEDLSNKEFKEETTLENIKNNHIDLFNKFETEINIEKEKESELNQKIKELDQNKFKNIILKYDDIQSDLLYFNQIVSLIKDLNLEEFIIHILLSTKDPEVFNLFNYQNIFQISSQKNPEENKENNIDTSSSRKYEGEFDENTKEKNLLSNGNEQNEIKENEGGIEKLDEKSEKILKQFAHFIVIEGSTPNLYLNPFKEEITQDDKNINVINPEKLFNYMIEKKIEIDEKEKEEIINKYAIKNDINDIGRYIEHDKFAEKLFELMKNDDNINSDEDFLINIKSLEIDGID